MTGVPDLLRSRRLLTVAVLLLSIVGLLGVPGVASAGSTSPASGHGLAVGHPSVTRSPSATPAPLSPPPASGRGTFFNTTAVPNAPFSNLTCYYSSCFNVSNNPSINLTSKGTLAVAYVADTNLSPCPSVSRYAFTEVGFVASTNLGSTWTTPAYLGNPDCTAPSLGNYPNSWEPSLTSLGNGTLVLAYVEYNISASSSLNFYPPFASFGPYSWNIAHDRLVVTRSFNNGVSWTTPAVLNASDNPSLNSGAFAPQRPWITAFGSTVYVAWMNYSNDFSSTSGSARVHLRASTDGGGTWGPERNLTSLRSGSVDYSMNPTVAVTASGKLLVAYATNLTFHASYGCGTYGCASNVWTSDLLVASSVTNGSSFGYVTAASAVPVIQYRWGPFHDPSPQFAYSNSSGELYLTYAAGIVKPLCNPSCFPFLTEVVYVQNSSNSGATWSGLHTPGLASLVNPNPIDALYNPSLGVDANGMLHLEMTFVNYSQCAPTPFGSTCGAQYELYANSSDHGATFGAMILLSDNATLAPFAPDGEYATMIVAGARAWLAWTIDVCPGYATNYFGCFFPSGPGASTEIEISQPFTGTGLSLTFSETGLPAGQVWWANVMGNVRSATAPAGMVVSGIPPGASVLWNVSNDFRAGYGRQYQAPPPTPAPPAIISSNTTVTYAYSSVVLFNFETVPLLANNPTSSYCFGFQAFQWDFPACPLVNYNLTPLPSSQWVSPGTVEWLNVTPAGIYCGVGATCYSDDFLNLTFLAFSGTGAGSVNTTANSTRIVVNGPVNETASFQTNGWCYYQWPVFGSSAYACFALNTSLVFHEHGLPTGLPWNVTTSSGNVSQTNSSRTAFNPVVGRSTLGLVAYSVWSIPAPANHVWVASTTPVSPIEVPLARVVNVNFTLEPLASAPASATVEAVGLPNGTTWSISVDTNTTGVDSSTPTVLALSTGSHRFSAASVYSQNGTSYTPTEIDVQPYVVNQTWTNSTSLPSTVTLDGPALVRVLFQQSNRLTVDVAGQGTVSPGSSWVLAGHSVTLSASPAPGDSFVGWNGTGRGAVRSTQSQISVTPLGPVTELATFAPTPASQWKVNVTATGIPANVAYSVTIGNRTYTGSNAFDVTGLLTGTYAISVATAQENSSLLTQYVPTNVSTTFASAGTGLVTIASNGTLAVTFVAEYVGIFSASSGGTVRVTSVSGPEPTPAGPGSWYAFGSSVSVTALATVGYTFEGFNGSGVNAVNSTSPTITVIIGGPVTESALFVLTPIGPPATFNLTVLSTGLPSGTSWAVSGSAGSAAGATTALVVPGLNGAISLRVPTIYVGPGTRFVPGNGGYVNATVGADSQVSVAFTEQFLLSVTNTSGGAVNGLSQWVNAGGSVTLTASPTAGWTFAGWMGTGTGSVTASTSSITVTLGGPVTETPQFVPVQAHPIQTSSNAGQSTALEILVALLVVGVAVGFAVGWFRSRPPRTEPEVSESESASEPTDAPEQEYGMPEQSESGDPTLEP